MTRAAPRLPEWEISDKIRKARRSARLSQSELARRVGVTAQAVGNWESGANPPSEDKIRAVAKATRVPLWWFSESFAPGPRPPFNDKRGLADALPRLDSNQEPAGYRGIPVRVAA